MKQSLQPETAKYPRWSAEQLELYERIEAFRFDEDGATVSFLSRLDRENGWPRAYAVRVVAEYRKFAFLALVAGHPISPSDPVDQVWHLHLLYTRSYWSRFCAQTLGRALHHQPSQGGKREKDKFNAWYEATLESYRRYFGEQPPGDIWPDLVTRVGDRRFERVDLTQFHVISRSRVKIGGLMGAAALALLVLVMSQIFN